MLNCTKKTIISTDYSDVEALIKEVYGQEYEIMPMEEVGSSQYAATYNQNVIKGVLSEYKQEYIKSLQCGKPDMFSLRTIMIDMCNNGHLEEGEYIIDVNW